MPVYLQDIGRIGQVITAVLSTTSPVSPQRTPVDCHTTAHFSLEEATTTERSITKQFIWLWILVGVTIFLVTALSTHMGICMSTILTSPIRSPICSSKMTTAPASSNSTWLIILYLTEHISWSWQLSSRMLRGYFLSQPLVQPVHLSVDRQSHPHCLYEQQNGSRLTHVTFSFLLMEQFWSLASWV